MHHNCATPCACDRLARRSSSPELFTHSNRLITRFTPCTDSIVEISRSASVESTHPETVMVPLAPAITSTSSWNARARGPSPIATRSMQLLAGGRCSRGDCHWPRRTPQALQRAVRHVFARAREASDRSGGRCCGSINQPCPARPAQPWIDDEHQSRAQRAAAECRHRDRQYSRRLLLA